MMSALTRILEKPDKACFFFTDTKEPRFNISNVEIFFRLDELKVLFKVQFVSEHLITLSFFTFPFVPEILNHFTSF